MSRRSFLVAIGIFGLSVLSLGAGLFVLARHEPRRYAAAQLPDGPERRDLSDQCLQKVFDLRNAIDGDRDFHERFTEAQINSYLNEGLIHQGLSEKLLPDSITEPRVTIEEERLRLAFRYGAGFWSTVVSIDLRLWVPELQPNVVAVQLLGLHAGALPISSQFLLERISEVARQNAIEVTWYRHEGHPVAVVRFQPETSRSSFQLHDLRFETGAIVIKGTAADPSAVTPSE